MKNGIIVTAMAAILIGISRVSSVADTSGQATLLVRGDPVPPASHGVDATAPQLAPGFHLAGDDLHLLKNAEGQDLFVQLRLGETYARTLELTPTRFWPTIFCCAWPARMVSSGWGLTR